MKGFPHLEAVLKSDAALARELTALCKDVRRLERILEGCKSYSHAKEMLLIADSAKVESLLAKAGGDSESLVRILKVTQDGKVAESLLGKFTDAKKLADMLEGVGDVSKLTSLMKALGPERTAELIEHFGAWRFGSLASELDAKQLASFKAEVPIERIQKLEQNYSPDKIARAYKSMGLKGIDLMEEGVAVEWRGLTANQAKGTTLSRDLREQLAIEQCMRHPLDGEKLPIKMTDTRWHYTEGWVKMQQKVNTKPQTTPGVNVDGPGRPGQPPIPETPVNVHYVYNERTGMTDDFKVVIPGPRP
jgi:hypothetical protein